MQLHDNGNVMYVEVVSSPELGRGGLLPRHSFFPEFVLRGRIACQMGFGDAGYDCAGDADFLDGEELSGQALRSREALPDHLLNRNAVTCGMGWPFGYVIAVA
jgi:hypothetical protein